MKKQLRILLMLLFAAGSAQAQTDSAFNALIKNFNIFNASADEKFSTFKTQIDSSFLQFLQQAWKEFDVFKKTQPVSPKPREQPFLEDSQDTSRQKLHFISPAKSKIITEKEIQVPQLDKLSIEKIQSQAAIKTFDFYGKKGKIYYYPDNLPQLQGLNENSILTFYNALNNNKILWDYNLSSLEKMRKEYKLNDWGYYLILSKVAVNIFRDKNNQVLFIWYCLVKSGFQAKVGYNTNAVFLLLPIEQKLYNFLYLRENGTDYYIINNPSGTPQKIKTYEGTFDKKAKIFSFKLNELPVLEYKSSEIRQMHYKQKNLNLFFSSNLIDFMNTYPQCSLETYLGTPLSAQNEKMLDKLLLPLLEGKSSREKVDVLLDFIQQAIAYKTDMEQFGKERYMFAEECLYYPFADCEDRTNLLLVLVRRYTRLQSIVLDFPRHVTPAVHFPEAESGTFILYNGQKYIVCDPTYINAKSGMLQPGLKNQKPMIIDFSRFQLK